MLSPKLQRLFAVGAGTLPEHCIIDVGSIARWMHERHAKNGTGLWTGILDAARKSPRTFYWVSTSPGRPSELFGTTELAQTVAGLQQIGVRTIIQSREGLSEMLGRDTSVKVADRLAVIGAQVEDCPEQLFVLNGRVEAVLDLETGRVHSYWSQYRDGKGEPFLIPYFQAAVLPDPKDARGRAPGGRAAHRYIGPLEGAMLRDREVIAREGPVPNWMVDSLLKNADRIEERAEELKGTVAGVDAAARGALQRLLPTAVSVSGAVSPPLVVVPIEAGSSGSLHAARAPAFVLLGNGRRVNVTSETSIEHMLRELSATYPQGWIVPRALDLLGYMHDKGITLPEKVTDPAICAFALCPDDIEREINACPSAARLPPAVGGWLWDVKRKTPPPRNVDELATSLPGIVRELRARTRQRGLDALVDNDLAPTLPVLAKMERRGAWICATTARAWSQIQMAMTASEAQIRAVVGGLDPYNARPEVLLGVIERHGVTLPNEYVLPDNDAKNTLARLARHQHGVRALLAARTASEVQRWLGRIDDAGEHFRGRYFPLATGRWGMNAWPLQAMPKYSSAAKELRKCLGVPPEKRLLAADFSSFEVRLVAGLSGDPELSTASQQPDAIGYLASKYFGTSSGKSRGLMKQYIHPVCYGIEEWGFIREQIGVPVSRARNDYEVLRASLSQVFTWQNNAIATAGMNGVARTNGGWERDPMAAKRKGGRWVNHAIVSTLVQGLAADILRWCLRELYRTLPSMNAELVFQNHDELYVEVDKETLSAVRAEVKDVLERRVQGSGLVPPGVRLVAKLKEGATWADIL